MLRDSTGGEEILVERCEDKEGGPEGEEEGYADKKEDTSSRTGTDNFFRFGEGYDWMGWV